MTQDYYGTKRITAWSQQREGADGYAVKYSDGYTSWSPTAAFEAAYQPISAMSFGHAVAALKAGERVARAGWNGKGMYVWLQAGATAHKLSTRIGGVDIDHFEVMGGGISTRMPCLCMRAADGSAVIGWLASQTDILADDWTIVEQAQP